MDAALERKRSELKKAKAVYDDEATLGVTGGVDFRDWVKTNAPGYINADNAYSAAAAANSRALMTAYGVMGDKWTTDRNQLIAATTSTTLLPGLV